MNQKTQTTNNGFLGLRPDYDLRKVIAEVVKLSPDPEVRRQSRGWFPRLVAAAFASYLRELKAGKESQ